MGPGLRGSRPCAALAVCPGGAWPGGLPAAGLSLLCSLQLLARDLRGEMTLPMGDGHRPSPTARALGMEVTRLLSLSQVLPAVWGLGSRRGDLPGFSPGLHAGRASTFQRSLDNMRMVGRRGSLTPRGHTRLARAFRLPVPAPDAGLPVSGRPASRRAPRPGCWTARAPAAGSAGL